MKYAATLGAIAVVVLLGVTYHQKIIKENDIVGIYINKNYHQGNHLAEIPSRADTLILKMNGVFESGYWGNGIYHIRHSIRGTSIELIYNYQFGKAGFEGPLERAGWNRLRFILNEDQNQYYEKLN